MRIVLITQNDPFYLNRALDFLFKNISSEFEVVGAIVLSPSPFGKKLSSIQKLFTTLKIFGIKFTIYYISKLIISKIRRSDVINVLKKNNINIIKLNSSINSKESLNRIELLNPDILISIAGNEIFKKPLIDLAPEGCLNLHTALLPKYRGLMPSFWVLKNREKYTGVSVFYVDEGIDSGPIITQKRFLIEDLNQEILIKKTKELGMKAIIEALQDIKNKNVKLIENNCEDMTYFSFPSRKDVIDFYKNGARFF